MVVKPTTPKYLKWYEVPITFGHSDHSDFVLKSGWYPLIVHPSSRMSSSTESSSMEVVL
jgi:hypothetical protein